MSNGFCVWCGVEGTYPEFLDTECPLSVKCPSCKAKPGQWCIRPSGHPCGMHATRWEKAEAIDASNGIVYPGQSARLF